MGSQDDYIEVKEASARFDHLNQYFTLEDKGTLFKMGKWELEKKQISQLKVLWFQSNSKTIEWVRVPGKPKDLKPTIRIFNAGVEDANGLYVIEGQRDNAAKFVKQMDEEAGSEGGDDVE